MSIDISATNYAGMYVTPDQGGPTRILHTKGLNSPDDGASAVVAISDSGKLAAHTADVGMPPSSPSIEAMDNPAIPAENNPGVFLDKLLVEILSGRKIQGVSAADLQAVRESGANSDLLLKRIERAALRAGFGIERLIPQAQVTVDQTTFQAKGVIRIAHGS